MNILKEALDWADEHRSEAPIAHKAAFFNAVIYLVTGTASGVGGPSIREHLVSWSLAGPEGLISTRGDALTVIYPDGSLPRAGAWKIEQAIAHCDPLCFGDIRNYREQAELILKHEKCFDDEPADLEALRGKSA